MTILDRHLPLDCDHAADLLHLLNFAAELLRYSGDELREDIAQRYTPSTFRHLLDSLESHAALLHRAMTTLERISTRP